MTYQVTVLTHEFIERHIMSSVFTKT